MILSERKYTTTHLTQSSACLLHSHKERIEAFHKRLGGNASSICMHVNDLSISLPTDVDNISLTVSNAILERKLDYDVETYLSLSSIPCIRCTSHTLIDCTNFSCTLDLTLQWSRNLSCFIGPPV